MNYQDKVAEFMRASGQLVASDPRELTKEELDFRDSLLREEIRELQYAIADNNRVEILDALCDIKYVNDGTANMMGYRQDDEWQQQTYKIVDDVDECLEMIYGENFKRPEEINTLVYSLASLFGFSLENFKTALDRVHASNMSKFTYDIKTAEKTQQFYKDQGIDTYLETREKLTTIYRQEDGKVLKSIEYHPVYLEDLV